MPRTEIKYRIDVLVNGEWHPITSDGVRPLFYQSRRLARKDAREAAKSVRGITRIIRIEELEIIKFLPKKV